MTTPAANPPGLELKRTALLAGGINRLIYTMSNGDYVGSIVFDGVNPDALRALANDFQAFIVEQTGGISVAPPGALRQIGARTR
jgi:hypothetical protein